MFVGQFQEIPRVLLLYGKLGPVYGSPRRRGVEIRLARHCLLIGTVFNLMDQDVLGPPKLLGPTDVEFTFVIVLAALQNHRIQLISRTNGASFSIARLGFIEVLDSAEVSRGEAADSWKLRLQIPGEAFHYGTPPRFAGLPLDN